MCNIQIVVQWIFTQRQGHLLELLHFVKLLEMLQNRHMTVMSAVVLMTLAGTALKLKKLKHGSSGWLTQIRGLEWCWQLVHILTVTSWHLLFYVCGFSNNNPLRVRRYAIGRTRFTIMLLTTHFTRIAVGDCRDGILFYCYHEDARKLEQIYCDPSQRLVAASMFVDTDTAVVSDRKGTIAILSCSDRLEDNASPECNLSLSCAYYMGEIAMSIRKGSYIYKLPADDVLGSCDGPSAIETSQSTIIASTLLGGIVVFIPISREEYDLLEAVQARLAAHPLTAPVLGNDHTEYRGREILVGVPKILDGDLLSQFLELTSNQQETILSITPSSVRPFKSASKPQHVSPLPMNRVVQLLERVHYALN